MEYCYTNDEVKVNAWKGEIDCSSKHNICYEEFTSIGKSIAEDPAKLSGPHGSHVLFKILDYNILAQTHMQHHLQLYRKCPRQSLIWNYRKCILKREFEEMCPDIFCLQEVEDDHRNELLEPWRKRGYEDLYLHRGKGKPDGCAILYKKSMFRAVDYAPVHYFTKKVRMMNKPNVGMVVKLELTQHPGSYLVIANTHLLYNQSREDIKLCQLVLLLAELEKMARNPGGKHHRYHPIILTGDLNVGSKSSLISLLTEGNLDLRNATSKKNKKNNHSVNIGRTIPTDELESCLNLSLDGCKYANVEKTSKQRLEENSDNLRKQEISDSNKRPFVGDINHNFSFDHIHNHSELDQNRPEKINLFDYMFYSSEKNGCQNFKNLELCPGELRLLSRLRLPTLSEYSSKIRAIPNHAFGSDHFPLTAMFLLSVRPK